MEQIAVVVIARKLGLQRSLVFQRGRRSSQLRLKVRRLRGSVDGCRAVHITHFVVKVDLLAVVVDERFLLNVGLIAQVGVRVGALLVGHVGLKKEIKGIGGEGFGSSRGRSSFSLVDRREVDGGGGLPASVGFRWCRRSLNFEGFRLGGFVLSYLCIRLD